MKEKAKKIDRMDWIGVQEREHENVSELETEEEK